MNPFAVIFAICCHLATLEARPGYSYGHGEKIPLDGVPNESHYGKLSYPKLDVIHLGSAIKGSLPPAVVEINKKVIIKEPQPYPVKVGVPVPHPIEVPKPYPVVETKIVKVPHPVPYEVIKKIPVPFEVPKPYPVPSEELKSNFGGQGHSYGGGFSGQQHLDEVHGETQEAGGFGGGYGGGFEGGDHAGGYAEADQSQSYGTQVQQAESAGWVPVIVQMGEGQQAEEHQQ